MDESSGTERAWAAGLGASGAEFAATWPATAHAITEGMMRPAVEDGDMTLMDFLLARIAEDEAVAREALREEWADQWWPSEVYDDGVRNRAVAVSPRRVLADCEAKRRIIELHNPNSSASPADATPSQPTCDDWSYGDASTCPELCALALPYADHPEYRSEWAP